MENPNGHKYGKEITNKEYVLHNCDELNRLYEKELEIVGMYVDVTPDTQSADCSFYFSDTHEQITFNSGSVMDMWAMLRGMGIMRQCIISKLAAI